jgi:hypothetical protein
MNHSVSEVIARLLIAQSFGYAAADLPTPADYQITYGKLPDEGDYAITAFDVEGKREDKRDMRRGTPTIFPGVSVQVRAPSDGEASPKIWAVAAYLDGLSCKAVVVGASTYRVQNFSRVYNPTFLMEEERGGRRVWVFRGNVTIFQES